MAEKKQNPGSTGAAKRQRLTDKEELFCRLYLKNFNATRAYQEAYGVSWDQANRNAYKKLRLSKIRDKIEKLKAERFAEIELTKEDLIRKHAQIAFSDITDFIEIRQTDAGTMYPVLKEGFDGSAIAELTFTDKVGGIKIRLADKQKSLDWLAKAMGAEEEHAESGVVLIPEVTDG